jgi:hypothetical protein
MTYFADSKGLIYWALGHALQDGRRRLRAVLSYVPTSTGGYRKCVFHGYDFEVEQFRDTCAENEVDSLVERVLSFVRRDRRSGDQYLALPRREIDVLYEPIGVETYGVDKFLDPVVLDALRRRLKALDVHSDDVRFYGRVACGIKPNGKLGDVDIVLDQPTYRAVIEREASRRKKIPLDGLDRFFLNDARRLATVKRRWSLSQLALQVGEETVQLDVKVAAPERPTEHARLYYDRSWGRLHEIHDVEITVTDATWALSPAPLLEGATTDGRSVTVSSKHYMFSGMATEDDIIHVTGVMDDSRQRLALTDPFKHFVAVDLPHPDLFE